MRTASAGMRPPEPVRSPAEARSPRIGAGEPTTLLKAPAVQLCPRVSPDGKYVAAIYLGRLIRLYDVHQSIANKAAIEFMPDHPLTSQRFSRNGFLARCLLGTAAQGGAVNHRPDRDEAHATPDRHRRHVARGRAQ